MKESLAMQMPNVYERFPKDADSASVEMDGKETVVLAWVNLIVLKIQTFMVRFAFVFD